MKDSLPPNNILRIRESRGMSQSALADLMGTSKDQISKHETRKRQLTHQWIVRYAGALGCRQEEILGDARDGQHPSPDLPKQASGDSVDAALWDAATEKVLSIVEKHGGGWSPEQVMRAVHEQYTESQKFGEPPTMTSASIILRHIREHKNGPEVESSPSGEV